MAYYPIYQTMVIVASLHCRSGKILMYGWTMSYKWGHPVTTLPVTKGTIRHTHRMTEILRIKAATNPCIRAQHHSVSLERYVMARLTMGKERPADAPTGLARPSPCSL
eukprot:3736449-Pleurochrysis_carterae.AAC.1